MRKKFKNDYSFSDVQSLVTPNQLSHVLAEPVPRLRKLALNANNYYDPFEEEGKNGKMRKIDKPTGDLKKVQKKIVDRILKLYPLVDITYGAVEGKSTRDNALNHIKKKVVVRIDLSDCFHSIKSQWVYRCFRKRFRYSKSVAKLLTQLCTYNGSIPVGSPLSSMLVNVVLDPLWVQVKKLAENENCDPSIWVDDVIFSGDEAEKLISPIKKLINHHGLKIGWHKLDIMRSRDRQEGTGCSLNSGLGIPKRTRLKYAKKAIESVTCRQVDLVGQIGYTTYISRTQGRQLKKLVDRLNSN